MKKEEDFSSGHKAWITRNINEFKKKAELKIKEIDELRESAEKSLAVMNDLINQTNEIKDQTEIVSKDISKIHDKVFEENESGYVIGEDIEGFASEFEQYKIEIQKTLEDISEYESELNGYRNDEGIHIEGIKSRIEGFLSSTSELYQNNSKKQSELFKRIESLLKGASTVALAKAFNDHKQSFVISNRLWILLFFISIGALMTFSIITFKNVNYELSEVWKYTLGNLPFLGGAIWLAVFASKQRSQNKRLQQEYAYKEDVAKIYYGLKQELEDLGDSRIGKDLKLELIETILKVVGENPSDTLDSNSHNDKGPILESLKSISESIAKLRN